jgi:hypothetical protein
MLSGRRFLGRILRRHFKIVIRWGQNPKESIILRQASFFSGALKP